MARVVQISEDIGRADWLGLNQSGTLLATTAGNRARECVTILSTETGEIVQGPVTIADCRRVGFVDETALVIFSKLACFRWEVSGSETSSQPQQISCVSPPYFDSLGTRAGLPVFALGHEGAVTVCDFPSEEIRLSTQLPSYTWSVGVMEFSPDGRWLVADCSREDIGEYDHSLLLWDLQARILSRVHWTFGSLIAFGVSVDGHVFASVDRGQEDNIQVFEAGRVDSTRQLPLPDELDGPVIIQPALKGTTLDLFDLSGRWARIDADTGHPLQVRPAPSDQIDRIVLNGDGRVAVSLWRDSLVVWEVGE